ncbi:hypothetical protein [Paraburkholderia phenoliruptrix]|uniref:hypothetical protein n=1 Tax=Paraburkholderia phenoliruptrix TaxID=252970 RepID=UPI0001C02DB8|nr:hypothetical protein [Paraburkholderia phenoliruptrix]MDR6392234.1 DNA-directed RNA polymerase subunit RPC12/RpoP [Paraburkholderia phenoliruptrix]
MTENRQAWRMTSHCCRRCAGRVLERDKAGGGRFYRCAQCGFTIAGQEAAAVCCCGITLRDGRDAGVRCVLNEERTPANPHEIVALQVDV